jgi:4-hydroxy-tetrahydrodipicolinate synthase
MHKDRHPRLGTAITALVTPFRNGAVDLAMLDRLAQRQVHSGIDGLAVCTVTGEGPTLSPSERAAVIGTCVRVCAGRVPVIAATGTNATASTIALTRQAEDLGATAALVTVPFYSKPGQKGIIRHFEEVAAATGLPLLIDDNPSRCASGLTAESIEALSATPSIIGIVGAGIGNGLHAVPAYLQQRFLCLSSDDRDAAASLARYPGGTISCGANVHPHLYASLHRSARNGDIAATLSLEDRLQPLTNSLAGNPCAVKYALHVLLGMNADVRLPMVELEPCERAALFCALTSIFDSRAAARAM